MAVAESGPLELEFSETADLYFLLRHLAALSNSASAGDWSDEVGAAKDAFDVVRHVPPYAIDP